MKTIAILAIFFCIYGQVLAHDGRLTDDCLNGIVDKDKCCEGVPDAWYAHLRNPADCGSFYQCEHEKATWKACPVGLEWSVTADKCDWPESAQCKTGNGGGENTTEGNNEGGNENTTEGSNNGGEIPTLPKGCYDGSIDAVTCCEGVSAWFVHLPDPNNCGKFFQCDNGKAVHKDCPAGLHWSVTADRCEWPHLAGCEGSGTIIPTLPPTTTVASPTTNTPSSQEDQCAPGPVCNQCITGAFPADLCCRNVKNYYKLNLANAKDCSSYYTCVNDHATLRQCPNGLHWSIETDRCEWPKNANCNVSNEGGNNGGNNDGNNGQSNECLHGKIDAAICCKNVPSWIDVLLQNNADCHTYFQCVHGKPMVRPCPDNLWWSITANRCEWKENATCTW